jgi:CheY-like chemotaxis protein
MQPAMRMIPGLDADLDNRTCSVMRHGPRRSENDNHRSASRSSTTVLVVEDDVLVRMAIAAHLRDTGYRVIETATAEEARAALEAQEPIALIFSDIDLPSAWQGSDLAEWLHRHAPAVKVILTSSAFRPRAGLKTTCDGFLPKPYLAEEVTANVKALLGR